MDDNHTTDQEIDEWAQENVWHPEGGYSYKQMIGHDEKVILDFAAPEHVIKVRCGHEVSQIAQAYLAENEEHCLHRIIVIIVCQYSSLIFLIQFSEIKLINLFWNLEIALINLKVSIYSCFHSF